ncbi:hypothetical protein CRYUN_Cryun31cG0126900 [Craigia yunnanensis]
MWSNDENFPARGFLTPQPPAWKKTQSTTVLPMSERKRLSPANNGDCFHVIHKVAGQNTSRLITPFLNVSLYYKWLIGKDPNKAISLFWAAINAGDRVESALKDRAVVMKQLNRSDEAIEAIKSFRHLCPHDSQGSLDNVLVELYKRSGRVEEEIAILHNKLRNLDEGTVFGGKRTKIARSQGKKIQITIEQEKSRILGNLAWAYLQQHNYGIAEQHYRKALFLEPDKNKRCNLAICLMHMNRISEAKSLLQDVKASSGNEQMDESYSKSYERALEMLIQEESQSMLEPVAHEQDKGRETRGSSTSYRDKSLKEASVFLPRDEDNIPGFMDRRRLPYAHWQGKTLSDEQKGEPYSRNHLEKDNNLSGYDNRSSQCTPIGLKGNLQSSPLTTFTEKWRKGSYLESPCEGSLYSIKLKENDRYSTGQEVGSAHKKIYASSAASIKNSEALFTQPRRCSWGFNTGDKRREGRWGEDTVRNSVRKLSFEQTLTTESVPSPSIQNLNKEPHASSNGMSENSATGQGEEEVQEGLSGVLFTQPRNSLVWLNNLSGYDNRSSQCTPIGLKGNLQSSPLTTFTEKWRKGSYLESPCEGSLYSIKLKENDRYSTGQENLNKEPHASSNGMSENSATGQGEEEVQEGLSGVLFTQPRNSLVWLNNLSGYDNRSSQCTPIGLKGNLQSSPLTTFTEKWRKGSYLESPCEGSLYSIKLKENDRYSTGQENLNKEPHASSNGMSENSATGQGEEEVQEGLSGVLFTQPRNSLVWLNNRDQRRGRWAEESVGSSFGKLSFEKTISSVTSHSAQNLNGEPLVSSKDESEIGLEKPANAPNKKSWADMVEEEDEEELLSGRKNLVKKISGFNKEEEFDDENLNSNIIYQHPDSKNHIGNITQQLESYDMKGGYNASKNTVSSRRIRLRVFRDITGP